MKFKIALYTLLAAISTATRAHARIPSRLRDPRTVEEKKEVHRQTMGEHVSSTLLVANACDADGNCATCGDRLAKAELEFENEASSLEEKQSLACSAVSKEFAVCRGCQGYSKMGKEVHVPGCVEMPSGDCLALAKAIVQEKPNWFKDGLNTDLTLEENNIGLPSEMDYYKLGLPVLADTITSDGSRVVVGVAGDCMVHYPWDWCVNKNGETACIKLGPWDCSSVVGGCLSAKECCVQIQDKYPKPDINGNELQCYEWILPTKSGESGGENISTSVSSGSVSGGVTGSRLVIHLRDNEVALPAVITGGIHEVVQDEGSIVPKDGENTVTQQDCTDRSFPNDFTPDPAGYNPLPKTLMAAVTAYVGENCATNPDCPIGVQWGHPINSWCVEKVTNFNQLFSRYIRTDETVPDSFNEDINGWTTSQVTTMYGTFSKAKAFNQPLNNWDVSSVTNMGHAFFHASVFNHPLDNWNVTSVYGMGGMFSEASAFNQPLNSWDTSSVTYIGWMFKGVYTFNQPLNNWNVSSVSGMTRVFNDAKAFNQPLDSWDVSSVKNLHAMFQGAIAFNQDLCNFRVCYEQLYDASYMFDKTSCPYKGSATSARGPWCQKRYC